MRHRVKKIKFKFGKDHNKMMMRKLVINFLRENKITTTLPKAKALKMLLDKLIYRSREKTEANKNLLLKYLGDKKWVKYLFEKVGPAVSNRVGGYVRIVRLLPRESDGAKMARIEWVEDKLKIQNEKVKIDKDKKEKSEDKKIKAKAKEEIKVAKDKKDGKANTTDKTSKGK